jgi:transposase
MQTIGLDLGDRRSVYCVLNRSGEIVRRGTAATTQIGMSELFGGLAPSRVVLEVGTHSPWVSRLIASCGHEVIVANARKVKAISKSTRKSDRVDAEMLARLGRVDVALLSPIEHRGESVQADRAIIRSRDALVSAQTALISSVRGQVKAFGQRLPASGPEAFARKVLGAIPEPLRAALEPLVEQVGVLTQHILRYDRLIEERWQQYPGAHRLRQVKGVGALTALAFVTAVEDPKRLSKSRDAGPFMGLIPKRSQSGERDPELGITKTGDECTRRLLVQAAHYILGHFGPDCALRRYGERIIEQGGRAAKRRAAVAVARKLSVLLHRLWLGNEDYDPHRGITSTIQPVVA